ncbi:DUF3055 domain-containing protein [Pasteuria penetrans]|uniref:DUF3055 domain-containing protein n=1 Tax=Pasteuria penetrans TaxID=86005 RepID=UPI000F9A932C|nr:DUF3055 domain-containing protein [Pasteuria penetrans]
MDHFLYDDTETTRTRFIGFAGETQRFDLAVITTQRFYGKFLVLDMQSNQLAILGPDDLKKNGYLEEAYGLDKEGGQELRNFLELIII